jgi:hypothetical protein
MGKIPQSLNFLEGSICAKEVNNLVRWHNFLRPADQENVAEFLKQAYDWAVENTWHTEYLVANAVGSTINGKKDYRDIDFLLVTDMHWDYATAQDLEKRLKPQFSASIDPFLNVVYASLIQGRPERKVMTVVPHRREWKKIHAIIQPEIPSEQIWDDQDIYLRVPLYRIIRER